MSEILAFTLALATGLFLGAMFFGGLWWTVRKGISSPVPAAYCFAWASHSPDSTMFRQVNGKTWSLASLVSSSRASLSRT